METNTLTINAETMREFPEVRAHLARLRSFDQERAQGGAELGVLDQARLQRGLDVSSRGASWKARRTGVACSPRPIAKSRVEEVLFPFWPEVLDGFKATGEGWQTRINTVLRTALAEGKI